MLTDYQLALAALEAYPGSGLQDFPGDRVQGKLRWDIEYLRVTTVSGLTYSVCGSEADLVDWARNFVAIPWPDSECGMTHLGWLLAGRRLAKKIDIDLEFLRLTDYDLYSKAVYGGGLKLSGHSLGGAVAAIAAQILSKKYLHPVGRVLVFGCPKPFFMGRPNYKFDLISFENDNDPVTKLPLSCLYKSVSEVAVRYPGLEQGHKMSGYIDNFKQTLEV